MVKEYAFQCKKHRRCVFNPWVRRIPWSRKWQPSQYSCLENSMEKSRWATVHTVAESDMTKHARTSVQFSSVAQSCLTLCDPWTAACQAFLSITNSWSLLRFVSVESVMPSNHLTLCRPLLLPPSIFPSIRVFTDESVLRIRWPKYWSFSFSISPSNDYSGLISFRISSQSKGLSKVFFNTTVQKHQFFSPQLSL